MQKPKPKALLLYHYFFPDDVVSARHFSDFAVELSLRGWEVEAMPCNRGCRNESRTYTKHDVWQNIQINRIWRPKFKQASSLGRILNSLWMIGSWSLKALTRKDKVDVLVIGSDPVLSVMVAPLWKLIRPSTLIAYWCYDLYPEGAIAEGLIDKNSILTKAIKSLLKLAYNSCDLVADLGICMRYLMETYRHTARKVTLVPWALYEPDSVVASDFLERNELFGDAKLCIMYSGNFGRAHSYEEILELARILKDDGIHFSFGVRGNCADMLYNSVSSDDKNITFAGFAPECDLGKRLAAADIHLVTLRTSWTGVVVPSKFFGSLAAGRPVIFAGSRGAAISRWIEKYKVGWVLDREALPSVAQQLRELAKSKVNFDIMKQRCFNVYQNHFSKQITMNRWDHELRILIDNHRRPGLI